MSDKEEAEFRNPQIVREKVERASSEILDTIEVKGKVIKSGAFTISCSDYATEDKAHRMRHPWSIYEASGEQLKAAMEKLRKELPAKGWKIVKDGPDRGQAQLPQIVANSPDGHMSADIRLWIEPPGSKQSSMIEVTVVSDCFRDDVNVSPEES